MKILIVYETLHGTTEKCAKLLRDKLPYQTDILSLKLNDKINIDDYDLVVIGGSIHMGVIHTRVKNFIDLNHGALLQKPHALYLCCMEQGENARIQFEHAYSEELRNSSNANGLFGGEFDFRKMNQFEKFFTRKVARKKESVSMLNYVEINNFAEQIKKSLNNDFAFENKF